MRKSAEGGRRAATLRVGAGLAAWLAMGAVPAAAPLAAQSDLAGHPRVAEALDVVEIWLEAERAYEQIPGLSAALVHDQELVWSGAVGWAHPDRGVEATPSTLYSICSISKLFTSIAVMQLRDRGMLSLSDPVSELLPWFDLPQQFPEAPPVTVEGILTHSSGLPRESNHPYWSAPDFDFPTREQIIEGLSEQETLYPSWTYFQYSNLGLTLAGEIVAELSGTPYDRYVRENVLDPLGMDDTWPEIPEEHRGGRFASGFGAMTREGRREPVAAFRARGIAPAAGYASTVEDLARFASWQFRLTGDREEVLHAHTLGEMHRVHFVDPDFDTYWGLGFAVSRRDDVTFVGHGGSCPGYRSQLLLQPNRKVAAVFMANASGVNTSKYVLGMFDLVAPAIGEATGDDDEEGEAVAGTDGEAEGGDWDPSWSDYLGTYSVQPWGGEEAVVRWKDGVWVLPLPTDNPARALTELRHVEGDTFRRVRDDGELAEAITFERDDSGRVTHLTQHNNRYPKIR